MVMFQVEHQGFSRSIGFFTEFEGVISLDAETLGNSSVTATIEVGSIDLAHYELWNQNTLNLFFDVDNHPLITFNSTSVEDLGENRLAVTGDLTMNGVTKRVTLDTTLNKVGQYAEAGEKAGFSASLSLNRSAWGMKTNIPTISDQIDITIQIEAMEEGAKPIVNKPIPKPGA